MTGLVRVAARSTAGDRDRLAADDRDRLPARWLAVAPGSGGAAVDLARRTAALVMVAAVLIGTGGVAMAAATFLTGAAVGPVLTATAFVGVLLARNAWRYRIG
jgi:hypothetical protein